jgi:hypothetical protein
MGAMGGGLVRTVSGEDTSAESGGGLRGEEGRWVETDVRMEGRRWGRGRGERD